MIELTLVIVLTLVICKKKVMGIQMICSFFLNVLGKILNDDTALKEYKIDEKNFVVVMVTKVSFSLVLYIFMHVKFLKNIKIPRPVFISEYSLCTSIVADTYLFFKDFKSTLYEPYN